MENNLERLAEIRRQINALEAEAQELIVELEAAVKTQGPIWGHGLFVSLKAGRKSTDWQSLITKGYPAEISQPLIVKHTVVTEKVSWAKVGKELKPNRYQVAQYTKEGEPTLVIEDVPMDKETVK